METDFFSSRVKVASVEVVRAPHYGPSRHGLMPRFDSRYPRYSLQGPSESARIVAGDGRTGPDTPAMLESADEVDMDPFFTGRPEPAGRPEPGARPLERGGEGCSVEDQFVGHSVLA